MSANAAFVAYQITPDVKVDPTPAPADNIVDTLHGVQVVPKEATDPAKPAVAESKPAADPERPSWLPEKFKTPEDMAKSYGELEKKLGASRIADTSATDGKAPAAVAPVTPAPAIPADVAAAATAAKVDMNALSTEFAQHGKLSDTSMKSLSDAGITTEQVTAYIAGQTAIAAQTRAEIVAVAGGETQFTSIMDWAKSNLPADDAAAYNAATETGNKALVKIALAGVVAQYNAANGKPPVAAITTAVPAATDTEYPGFKSNAEMVAAMKDPRYAKDPAYNAAVAKRMANTK